MKKDHVDAVIDQWAHERPELDTQPMALLGRFARVYGHLRRQLDDVFEEYGLDQGKFDVLATLRRAGAPYRKSPGELLAATMITSGTMTNRIDQLAKQGLVERIANPEDKRSVLIGLTDKGFSLIDEAVGAHVKNQHRLAALLTTEDCRALNDILRRYLAEFES
jgi:DNA-binding MarR family transcriptional regulator